jgi:hypothetical protein
MNMQQIQIKFGAVYDLQKPYTHQSSHTSKEAETLKLCNRLAYFERLKISQGGPAKEEYHSGISETRIGDDDDDDRGSHDGESMSPINSSDSDDDADGMDAMDLEDSGRGDYTSHLEDRDGEEDSDSETEGGGRGHRQEFLSDGREEFVGPAGFLSDSEEPDGGCGASSNGRRGIRTQHQTDALRLFNSERGVRDVVRSRAPTVKAGKKLKKQKQKREREEKSKMKKLMQKQVRQMEKLEKEEKKCAEKEEKEREKKETKETKRREKELKKDDRFSSSAGATRSRSVDSRSSSARTLAPRTKIPSQKVLENARTGQHLPKFRSTSFDHRGTSRETDPFRGDILARSLRGETAAAGGWVSDTQGPSDESEVEDNYLIEGKPIREELEDSFEDSGGRGCRASFASDDFDLGDCMVKDSDSSSSTPFCLGKAIFGSSNSEFGSANSSISRRNSFSSAGSFGSTPGSKSKYGSAASNSSARGGFASSDSTQWTEGLQLPNVDLQTLVQAASLDETEPRLELELAQADNV